MTNNARRGFLVYSGLFGLSTAIPSSISEKLGLDSKTSRFLVVFETIFPRYLTESEYGKIKIQHIDLDSANRMYDSFFKSGRILQSETVHSSNSSKWLVIFDGKASYYRWCYEVISGNYFDELKLLENGFSVENYGYRIPASIAADSVSEVLLMAQGFPVEKLHKTKSLDDLNEFQKKTLS